MNLILDQEKNRVDISQINRITAEEIMKLLGKDRIIKRYKNI